eukprot:CAMPEP_0180057590 /NCGR_PEP_ID=MMETSP0985-20121206/4543_1 /TAXON_ID=483367 /ORGANISM="non described non described, Strain CCMP 2436" /LENGTH=369 /DNA_ID=CAMNT_0021987463 /DNA_START=127 /DNA_END=1234 /DNA_ORIENTATION=-
MAVAARTQSLRHREQRVLPVASQTRAQAFLATAATPSVAIERDLLCRSRQGPPPLLPLRLIPLHVVRAVRTSLNESGLECALMTRRDHHIPIARLHPHALHPRAVCVEHGRAQNHPPAAWSIVRAHLAECNQVAGGLGDDPHTPRACDVTEDPVAPLRVHDRTVGRAGYSEVGQQLRIGYDVPWREFVLGALLPDFRVGKVAQLHGIRIVLARAVPPLDVPEARERDLSQLAQPLARGVPPLPLGFKELCSHHRIPQIVAGLDELQAPLAGHHEGQGAERVAPRVVVAVGRRQLEEDVQDDVARQLEQETPLVDARSAGGWKGEAGRHRALAEALPGVRGRALKWPSARPAAARLRSMPGAGGPPPGAL